MRIISLLLLLSLFPASSKSSGLFERYIIRPRDGVRLYQIERILSSLPVDTSYKLWEGSPLLVPEYFRRTFVLVLRSPVSDLFLLSQLENLVELVEPDGEIALLEDSLFSHQWNLNNEGQLHEALKKNPDCEDDSLILSSGLVGTDIDAPEAWEIEEEEVRETVIVGVIDSGCDSLHPDLRGAFFYNHWEVPNNGIDDDRNGFVDDFWGWDFSGDSAAIVPYPDNDPTDTHGHGTHVSGIIASKENGEGIIGVAHNVQILPLKIFPNSTVSVAVQAILYALSMGARVLNASWGSPSSSSLLEEALDFARSQGIVVCAAAGNSAESEDPDLIFPANSTLTLAVGASDDHDLRATFSSYGEMLDILAPGEDILSLRASGTDMYALGSCPEPLVHIVQEDWYLASGTSMAAPHATASVGVLQEISYGWKPDQVEENLKSGAEDLLDPNGDGSYLPGWDKYSGHGRINLWQSLKAAPKVRLRISSPRRGEILWGDVQILGTASGDDFSFYTIEVGEGTLPESWETLWESSSPVVDGLLLDWNTEGRSGIYTVRVKGPPNHEDRTTIYLVNEEIAQIESPLQYDTLQNFADIRGTASLPGFESLYVLLKKKGSRDWDTLYQSLWPFFHDIITFWSIPDTAFGDYQIRLVVKGKTAEIEDTVEVFVKRGGVEGWPVPFSGYSSITPRIADLEMDGERDVVITSSEGVYAFRSDGTLREGWPYEAVLDSRSVPAVFDINQDGNEEIIFVESSVEQSRLVVLDRQGDLLPGWPHTLPPALFLTGIAPPVLGDLDNDGHAEILVATVNGVLYAWNFDGNSYIPGNDGLFGAATGATFGQSEPSIIIADIDGDGSPEVSVSWAHPTWQGGGIWIWRKDGTPYSGYYASFWNFSTISGMVGGDVDGDGLIDLVLSGQEIDSFGVWVIKGDSTVPDGWPKILDLDPQQWLMSPPVVADLGGDGRLEIIVSASSLSEGRIYAWHSDGTPLSDPYMTGTGLLVTLSTSPGAPVVCDLTGDSLPEIIVRTSPFVSPPEEIWAFDSQGATLPGWPLSTEAEITLWSPRSPSLADLDGDGRPELLMAGSDGRLYAWHISSWQEEKAWSTYLHDNANSGLSTGPNIPSVKEGPERVHPRIAPPFPNPTRGETNLVFNLFKRAEIAIQIYDCSGRLVERVFRGTLEKGEHRFIWTGRGTKGHLPSGVYFLHLKTGKSSVTFPVVMVRK